jgi:hypothetical protein
MFDRKYLPYLVIGLVVLFLVYKRKEGFSESVAEQEKVVDSVVEAKNQQVATDSLFALRQEELPIQPTHVDPTTNTIMSGSGFSLQKEVVPAWGIDSDKYGANDAMDDGTGSNLGLTYNLCSPSCCTDQYPIPHKLPVDKFVCDNRDNYVPNSYTCSNQWQNAGCLCMTKKQASFLENRGGNA